MSGIVTLDEFFERECEVTKYSKEDKPSLERSKHFYWTGHPFVDAGLAAVLLISNKTKPEELTGEDIKNVIKFASNLYAKKEWASKYLHGMIFPNSGILMANPSMSKKRSPESIAKNLFDLYNSIPKILDMDSLEERCVICGRRKPAHDKYNLFMSVFPLLGTGGVPNFFHSANSKGVDICAYCLFLVQFMPIASYILPRVLVIHAYPYEKMLELCEEAVKDVKLRKLASDARGFKKPENFLFRKIAEITKKVEGGYKQWENVSVTIYYFICNNQNQIIDVIPIPNPILRFIAFAESVNPKGWRNILNIGWRIGKEKKEKLSFDKLEKEYANEVYRRLLNYESILTFFYNKRERSVNASWRLLKFYCVEVLGLNEETLEFIRDVGDRIVETIEKLQNNKLRRTVRELEKASRLWEFESFFVRVEKIRQSKGLPSALLTFDEFAKILTAYGEDINISWRTARDLLLFRIYEKLHDRLSGVEEGLEEKEEEEFEYWRGDME